MSCKDQGRGRRRLEKHEEVSGVTERKKAGMTERSSVNVGAGLLHCAGPAQP